MAGIGVSASRLYQTASILDVPISYFFEDVPPEIMGDGRPTSDVPVIDNQTTKLLRAYLLVEDDKVRKIIRDLVIQLAEDPEHKAA